MNGLAILKKGLTAGHFRKALPYAQAVVVIYLTLKVVVCLAELRIERREFADLVVQTVYLLAEGLPFRDADAPDNAANDANEQRYRYQPLDACRA